MGFPSFKRHNVVNIYTENSDNTADGCLIAYLQKTFLFTKRSLLAAV